MTSRSAVRSLGIAAAVTVTLILTTPVAPAAAKTPNDQLVIGTSLAQVLSLDPGQATESGAAEVISNMYDKLVATDPANPSTIMPQLAQSWTIEPDAIVFHLRPEAKFQSGNPLRAADVVWSLSRVMKMNQSASTLLKPLGYSADNIAQFASAVDDHTFRLGLPPGTNAEFVLYLLANSVCSVVDSVTALPHVASDDYANAWLRNHSAGSGPYFLVRWDTNSLILMDRNDRFWGKAPTLRRVLVRHVPESQVERLELQKGDIDIANALNASDLKALQGAPGLKIDRVRTGTFYVLSMNAGNQYLKNPDVRHAIALAIDYQGMANSILGPYGEIRQSPVPSYFPGALADTGISYDPEKARALLAKAGYQDGFPLTLKVIAETPRVDMATAIQASLGKIGIRVSIEQGNGSQMISAHRARDFELLMPILGGQMPNAIGALEAFTSNPDNRKEANLTGYFTWRSDWDIPELTRLTLQARQEPDPAKRVALTDQIQKLFIASAPAVLPLFERNNPVVVSDRVTGYAPHPAQYTRWDSVGKTP